MSEPVSPHNYMEPSMMEPLVQIKTEPETDRKENTDQHQADADYETADYRYDETSEEPAVPLQQPDKDLTKVKDSDSTAELDNEELDNDELDNDKPKVEKAIRPRSKRYRCTICRQRCRGEKTFFAHLKTHYVPKRGEQFQCSVCKEGFRAQVDYFLHLRVHYEPSLVTQLGNAITGKTQ